MEVNVEYGYIYDQTEAAFTSGKKIIIHKGGTGSGKTYDLMIFLIFFVAMRFKNKIITVVSESKPHLDIGAIRILKNLLISTGLFSSDDYNESKSVWKCRHTGSIIEFFSADRIDKALGARRFMLYGNEINSLKFEIFDELARRSEYVLGDFNPTTQFWLEKFIEYYGDVALILSNYTNNPFLPDVEKTRIERRAKLDPNFKRIHIDCEYGIYEGLVFPNFTIIPSFPENIDSLLGLDFGYTNDPTAIIRVSIAGSDLYLDELVYRTGLTNADISKSMLQLGIKPNYDEIIADCAEPKSIDEIRRYGFNVKPAMKGQDSINAGIDAIKQLTIHVTQRSVNLIKELRNYSWVTDKEGNSTNKPVDVFNHAIDAFRYAVTYKLHQPKYVDFFA